MKRRHFIYNSLVFAGTAAGSHWAISLTQASAHLVDFVDDFDNGLRWCRSHKAQLFIKKGKYTVTPIWKEFLKNQATLKSALKFNGHEAEFTYDVAIDFGELDARKFSS